MIRSFVIVCLFAQFLGAYQTGTDSGKTQTSAQSDTTGTSSTELKDTTPAKDPGSSKTTGTSKKDTGASKKHPDKSAASKPTAPTKSTAPTTSTTSTSSTSSAASTPSPTPPEVEAASKAVAALDSAIHLAAADGTQVNEDVTAKAKALHNGLDAKADPRQIAREAAKWTNQIYNKPSDPKPPEQSSASSSLTVAATPTTLAGFLLLVSLMSLLNCLAGFWLAGRASENNLKKSLRDAGLL